MLIPFGDYLPDMPAPNNPGTPEIENAVPIGTHYEPFPGPAEVSDNDITERVQGAYSCRDKDGNVHHFAGSATKIWKANGTDWDDVTNTGGAYTTGTDERWEFVQYGNSVIATNFADAIQTFELGVDSNFSDLGGSPPQCRYLAVVREFLVLINTVDGVSGEVPHRVQWSQQGNPSGSWTTSATTQADYQDLDSTKGWGRAISGGEYGVAFQERAINRFTYVGSPLIFQFDEVETDYGTQTPGGVCKIGNVHYYIGTDLQFYAFNGSQSAPIGANKVDRTFQEDIDRGFLDRVTSFKYPGLPLVCWAYSGSRAGGSGNISDIFMMNTITGRWGRVKFASLPTYGSQFFSYLHIAFVQGYTLEGLDAVNASIDALTISLDSQAWTGGQQVIAGFSDGFTLTGNLSLWYINNATPYDAWLITTRVQPFSGQRSIITRYRPIIEGVGAFEESDISTSILSYDTAWLNAGTVAGGGSPNSDGDVRTRSVSANYHQIRTKITGGFTKAVGVDVLEVKKVGSN